MHPFPKRHAEGIIAPVALPMPERQACPSSGRRHHDHAGVRDFLHLPIRGAECDDVTHPCLIHHLLVELTNPSRTCSRLGLGQHYSVETAVGNRAAAGHREALCTRTRRDHGRILVEHERWSKCREVLGIIGAGEHAHHGVEHRPVQRGEGGGASHRRIPIIGGDGLQTGGRHGLLREHVQRIHWHMQWFNRPVEHAFHTGTYADDLFACHRVHDGVRDSPHPMVGSAHALQARGDRQRRRHLNHQIHRPHVNAELQTARRHHTTQTSGFESLLYLLAAVFRHRPVMRHGNLLVRAVRPHFHCGGPIRGMIVGWLVRLAGRQFHRIAFAEPLCVQIVDLRGQAFA